jgi:hypothetical protein
MGLFDKLFSAKGDQKPPSPNPTPNAGAVPEDSALSNRPQKTPKLPDAAIAASLRLEAAPIGQSMTVAPSGEVKKGRSEGAVLTRESHTKWTVTNNTANPIEILPPSWHPGSQEGVQTVGPGGSVSAVSAYSEVVISPMRVHLPGASYVPNRAHSSHSPPITTIAGVEKRESAIGGACRRFLEAAELIRKHRYGEAQSKLTDAFGKLDFDVNRDDFVFMVYSYQRATFDLKGLIEKTQKKGDLIVAPFLVTPDEDAASSPLKALERRVEREATLALAVLCAKEIRLKVGAALSPHVDNHPQAGSVTPETDAILLLHAMGIELSPIFFRLAPGREEAYRLIKAQSKSSAENGLSNPG